MTEALTPRHEAPAEGAGDGHMSDCAIHNAPALPVGPCDCGSPFLTPEDIKRAHELRADPDSEDNERFASWYGDTLLEVHQRAIQMDAALRARSSAPEAREEALGNLLAVIHGDGGHRALEVGTKQAALEAEKIVAGLFAAPSADKLRIAVEALEPFSKAFRGLSARWEDHETHWHDSGETIKVSDLRRASEAFASLETEGVK